MNEKLQDEITRPLDKIVMCPMCKAVYTKVLYDWQYIHCNDCGTYFEKHTGKLINHKGTPQQLPKHFWETDRPLK